MPVWNMLHSALQHKILAVDVNYTLTTEIKLTIDNLSAPKAKI